MLAQLDIFRAHIFHAFGLVILFVLQAVDKALEYAKQRQAFGQPIANFQVIAHYFADMQTKIAAGRALTYHALKLYVDGGNPIKEVSMAKLFCAQMSCEVINTCLQIYGGYGFTKDYPVEKYWRDSKLCTIGEGTSEIQRLVIARELLGG